MPHQSRRQVLGGFAAAGAALIASPVSARRRPFFGTHGETLGLQIYTLGSEALKDLQTAFAEIARIGFRAVELLSFGDQQAQDMKAALRSSGLVARSTQTAFTGPGPNLTDHLDRLIREAHLLDLEYVAATLFDIPAHFTAREGEDLGALFKRAAREMSADDWKGYAEKLNAVGAKLKRQGLRLAHHNHNLEFAPVAGSTGFDLIVANTDPALVVFEMDVGWVAAAGHDPIALLNRYPGRFRLMHVKDIKPETKANFAFDQIPAIPGEGVLDWTRLLPAAKAAGVTHYYVEQEGPFAIPRIEAVRRNHCYLSKVRV